MSKPYNLPPPWNSGYALPQNVADEGLERHAYTTAWAPDGLTAPLPPAPEEFRFRLRFMV